jgi:hypothetical protein
MNILKNTGLILGSGTKNLWVGGTIPYQVVLESGNWQPFIPVGEKQRPGVVDVMACVTFSDLSVLETQEKQQTGVEPNWSDRFIAKLSGTTPQGNYLDKVADTVRLRGLVKESDYPAPTNFSWDSYYSEVPQSVLDKAVKREILYEGISGDVETLKKHLKQCPIQIILTNSNPNHAVTLLAIQGSSAIYFDSYDPFVKTTDVSNIYKNYALKIVLKGNMNQTKIVLGKDGQTVYKATPVATDFENFKKQAEVEGITVPNPIPKADTL